MWLRKPRRSVCGRLIACGLPARVVLVALACLLLAGCGGAASSTTPGAPHSTSSGPSASDSPAGGSKKMQILVLGDSYSAGNGAGDYTGPTGCLRSPNNYARNFQTMIEVKYGLRALVTNDACSGEQAAQFFTSVSGRAPESAAVNDTYKLVLLTFGGDDINFGGIVEYCLIAKFQSGYHCIRNLDTAVADLKGGVQNSPVAYVLSSDLQYIHSHDPNAKIALLGYPYLESDQDYAIVDRREGSNSVARDACGQRQGTTNIVTVGQCLREIGAVGEQIQSQLVANLNNQDRTSDFVFVSTQKLFAGTQPGFAGPNHELTATAVNPNRWFIQPFVDVDPGHELLNTPWGSPVFYHPDPTGWEEEAKLLMATPSVVDGLASGQATTTQTAPSTTTSMTASTSTTAPRTTISGSGSPSTKAIGTITLSGSGTTVTEGVSLGQLGYGQPAAPPQDVLSSMTNQNDALSSVIATSAFVYGELQFRYTTGSLPINLTFTDTGPFGNVSGGFPADAGAIFDIDGQWTDGGGDGSPVSFSMQSGSSLAMPFWIQFPEGRSNASPTIPQDQLNLLSWQLMPSVDQISNGTTTLAGPQAADCDGEHELLPFAQLPFTHQGNEYSPVADNSVHCVAGGAQEGASSSGNTGSGNTGSGNTGGA
jgi:hypothetical protein